MKKMSTKQKTAHNRVTTKRRKTIMKRREHVAILKSAHTKANEISRQLEKIRYNQHKAAKAQAV
tara:strand:+ start:176 stop:367 length:192 start_codon:yes stop_codon:yes gene_type:complete